MTKKIRAAAASVRSRYVEYCEQCIKAIYFAASEYAHTDKYIRERLQDFVYGSREWERLTSADRNYLSGYVRAMWECLFSRLIFTYIVEGKRVDAKELVKRVDVDWQAIGNSGTGAYCYLTKDGEYVPYSEDQR